MLSLLVFRSTETLQANRPRTRLAVGVRLLQLPGRERFLCSQCSLVQQGWAATIEKVVQLCGGVCWLCTLLSAALLPVGDLD